MGNSIILERRMIGIIELANYIGIRPQTIRNKLSLGNFPIPAKRIGRLIKWDRKDVDKYLDNLRVIN